MDESLDRAVAVVGVGAIMPDAPDAATFWENIKAGATASATSTPGDGTRSCTTTPTRRHRTRPTPKSAPGCATGCGTPSPGSCRPAAACDPDGRRPEVGGRLHAPSACRLRLPGSIARQRARRGRSSAMPGRGAALRPALRISFPELAEDLGRHRASCTARRGAARITTGCADSCQAIPGDHRGSMPGELSNSSRDGWRTCSTSEGPTTSSTPRARRPGGDHQR